MVISFLSGVIGAGMAAFVTFRTSRSKMAAEIQARWDAALLEQSRELAEAARSLRHHTLNVARGIELDGSRQRLDTAHERLRVTVEQLRLVGSLRVQGAARLVLFHVYAMRVQLEEGHDPRAADFPGTTPIGRLNDALQEFYRAVRQQLRVPDSEGVLHNDSLGGLVANAADQPIRPETL